MRTDAIDAVIKQYVIIMDTMEDVKPSTGAKGKMRSLIGSLKALHVALAATLNESRIC